MKISCINSFGVQVQLCRDGFKNIFCLSIFICFPRTMIFGGALLFIFTSSFAQNINRCVDPEGNIKFTDQPCSVKEEADIVSLNPNQNIVSGTKPYPIESRNHDTGRTTYAIPNASANRYATTAPLDCGNITLYSFSPYQRTRGSGFGDIEGSVSVSIWTEQCTEVDFELSGFGSRLYSAGFRQDLAKQFSVILSNRSQIPIRHAIIPSSQPASRIHQGQRYKGDFCVGEQKFEIVALACN